MDYTGEHLLPGQIGHLLAILSWITALFSTFAYWKETNRKPGDPLNWKVYGRTAFVVQTVSVISVFGLLIYIISHHFFEYKYVWQHSSVTLEAKYLLSSIWEGQEGSFLLWIFWHCLIGLLIIRKARIWEAPVMTVISFAQVLLISMIVGVKIGSAEIGSGLFVLLRNEMSSAPLFSNPNYLSLITDGNGLNPLLQNYWMAIHPPVLFLGFAAMIVPFAYAVSGLWCKEYSAWMKPALPWALFAGAILGIGIMMGAMWAYESLTFGGFWAWDPVENAALVPWLVLVACIHTMLIHKKTGRSVRSSAILILLSFAFILYSTFLTRSGILGDTSVHAFTGLGLNNQILALLLSFILLPAILLLYRWKSMPKMAATTTASSREFWMYTGAIVLFVSALSIISMTSIPVANKILGLLNQDGKEIFKPYAIGKDGEYAYNKIQIVIAILITALSGAVQYLRYRSEKISYFLKNLRTPLILSVVVAVIALLFGTVDYETHGTFFKICIWTAIIGAAFSIISNASYIWIGLKGKLGLSGGSISHLGFAVLLLGALISASNKEVLSKNDNQIQILSTDSGEEPGENITLIKNIPTELADFNVTYLADSIHPKKDLLYYKISFEGKRSGDHFNLEPNAFVNYKGVQGIMSNPDAKHYWNRDVFAYLTSIPDPNAKTGDSTLVHDRKIALYDSFHHNGNVFILEKLVSKTNVTAGGLLPDDTASVANFRIVFSGGSVDHAQPIIISRADGRYSLPDTTASSNLIVAINKLEGEVVTIGVKTYTPLLQFVTLKIYSYPFINLVWIGTFLLFCGMIISTVNRVNARYYVKMSAIQRAQVDR